MVVWGLIWMERRCYLLIALLVDSIVGFGWVCWLLGFEIDTFPKTGDYLTLLL